jgi:hypothetical protein
MEMARGGLEPPAFLRGNCKEQAEENCAGHSERSEESGSPTKFFAAL